MCLIFQLWSGRPEQHSREVHPQRNRVQSRSPGPHRDRWALTTSNSCNSSIQAFIHFLSGKMSKCHLYICTDSLHTHQDNILPRSEQRSRYMCRWNGGQQMERTSPGVSLEQGKGGHGRVRKYSNRKETAAWSWSSACLARGSSLRSHIKELGGGWAVVGHS